MDKIGKALAFLKRYTGKDTALKSLNYFNEKLKGELRLVDMVAQAMDQAYKEGYANGKKAGEKSAAKNSQE